MAAVEEHFREALKLIRDGDWSEAGLAGVQTAAAGALVLTGRAIMKGDGNTAVIATPQGAAHIQETTMTPDELRDALGPIWKNTGRAMTRINKLKAVPSVRHEQMLEEAREHLGEAMDALHALTMRIDDEEAGF